MSDWSYLSDLPFLSDSSHFYYFSYLSYLSYLSIYQNLTYYFFNRKTDSIPFMVKKYGLPELKISYYVNAMDACAQKYPQKKFNLLFLVVSFNLLCLSLT